MQFLIHWGALMTICSLLAALVLWLKHRRIKRREERDKQARERSAMHREQLRAMRESHAAADAAILMGALAARQGTAWLSLNDRLRAQRALNASRAQRTHAAAPAPATPPAPSDDWTSPALTDFILEGLSHRASTLDRTPDPEPIQSGGGGDYSGGGASGSWGDSSSSSDSGSSCSSD